MGCGNLICGKQSYSYTKEERLLEKVLSQFSDLNRCYSHDFVIKCHKNMLFNPEAFLLKYEKKIQPKQIVPHIILQKWKLILYGTNIDNQEYVDCIGFDKQVEQERIAPKTYRFSKSNPFEIRLQDLYFHKTYAQIQKDAGRVYLVPQIKQEIFEKLLKKIANHFPESGYSLGINYIIGYFLLMGMSEMDSFWMFTHLALNEKFLALGLFEKDLPLTKVIIEIFKNLLRRKNKDLYNYIYKQLQVDDSSWIVKWITSFFLSTFSIQFCHYILDYVFTTGILGLAILSYSIVNYFQNYIFKCEQPGDFMLMLQQLFSFEFLSHQVSIEKFMSSVYDVTLNQRDFEFLDQLQDSFYLQYFVLYSDWRFKANLQSREKMKQLLSDWYRQNILKRQTFTNKMANTYEAKPFLQSEESPKEYNRSHFDTNMDKTKEQRMAEKTDENIVIPSNLNQSHLKSLQEMHSNLENPQTIHVSSRYKRPSQRQSSSDEVDQNSSQIFDSQIHNFNQCFKRKFSQNLSPQPIHKQRRIKSNDDLYQNKRKQEIVGQNNSSFSIKSFCNQDKVSEDSVSFNQKPLSRQFPFNFSFSQTLPLRKNSESLTFKNNLQGKVKVQLTKTFYDNFQFTQRKSNSSKDPSNETPQLEANQQIKKQKTKEQDEQQQSIIIQNQIDQIDKTSQVNQIAEPKENQNNFLQTNSNILEASKTQEGPKDLSELGLGQYEINHNQFQSQSIEMSIQMDEKYDIQKEEIQNSQIVDLKVNQKDDTKEVVQDGISQNTSLRISFSNILIGEKSQVLQ